MHKTALAIAPEGMAMTDLHTWWQSAVRPLLQEDELAFFDAIPTGHRDTCSFKYKTSQTPVATPLTSLSSTGCGGLEIGRLVIYVDYASTEAMHASYDQVLAKFNIQKDTGSCPDTLPSEGPWNRSGTTLGRFYCFTATIEGTSIATIGWDTDPLSISALAIGGRDVTVQDLHTWWTAEAGPVYQP
jgi:hypothetical protein